MIPFLRNHVADVVQEHVANFVERCDFCVLAIQLDDARLICIQRMRDAAERQIRRAESETTLLQVIFDEKIADQLSNSSEVI